MTSLSSDGAELMSRSAFWTKETFFILFVKKIICICVFCGECGCICMISICVADNSYKGFFFFFFTQIILIVFCSGEINHLYDV